MRGRDETLNKLRYPKTKTVKIRYHRISCSAEIITQFLDVEIQSLLSESSSFTM